MICAHGNTLLCPHCKREDSERVRAGIRDGSLVFGVFKWTGDNRYPIASAIRVFKIRAAAEKFAAKNELVVRTVSTGGAK